MLTQHVCTQTILGLGVRQISSSPSAEHSSYTVTNTYPWLLRALPRRNTKFFAVLFYAFNSMAFYLLFMYNLSLQWVGIACYFACDNFSKAAWYRLDVSSHKGLDVEVGAVGRPFFLPAPASSLSRTNCQLPIAWIHRFRSW
jgi:hypothetical protein